MFDDGFLFPAGTAFHLQGGRNDDLVRRKVQPKLIPPRPSSVVPSINHDSSELNYFLAPSNHSMNKSHSATQIRPNFYSEVSELKPFCMPPDDDGGLLIEVIMMVIIVVVVVDVVIKQD